MGRRLLPWDLVVSLAIGLADLVMALLLPVGALQPFLGVPLALAVPGYLTILFLFPSRQSMDTLTRVTLNLATSVGLIISAGLLFVFLALPFTGTWILGFLLGIIAALSVLAELRRGRLPSDDRFYPSLPTIHIPRPTLPEAMVAGAIAVALITSGVLLYTVATRPTGSTYTTLYLLNSQGIAGNYPLNVTVGSVNGVIIGVVSHENTSMNFGLVVTLLNATDGGAQSTTNTSNLSADVVHFSPGGSVGTNFTLDPGQVRQLPMNFTIDVPGTHRLAFILLKDQNVIYRETFLWVNATVG